MSRASSSRRMLRLAAALFRGLLDSIAESANAPYRHAGGLQLVAQTADVDLERVGRGIGLVREDRVEKSLLADDPARVRDQDFQYGELARGELECLVAPERALA